MPTKIGVNQHDILHQHFPNDCCLCRVEQELAEARMKIVELESKLPQAKEDDERKYPCDMCGKLRSKNEGGTTFTVCDECWDKSHLEETPKRIDSEEEMLRWQHIICKCGHQYNIQMGECPLCRLDKEEQDRNDKVFNGEGK